MKNIRPQTIDQRPLLIKPRPKTDLRTQFAALCFKMVRKRPEFLLITSRGSGRWVIPKGWPADGKTPAESALKEAWEEAGVIGQLSGGCLGMFSYSKTLESGSDVLCAAMVFPIKVIKLKDKFPESIQRKRRWFSRKKAAKKLENPELAAVIKIFDPDLSA
ncbi:MAG: NUDIX hydrolase [Roseovarius sp.]|nr:NUDIX hydrolase [Roseovarius sp.]MCY4208392.1 NUDIX hydrolase [Roseovarius sp.]MCY4314856.1 NUDIX hydrolase [Roseovarius sp.]